jgi:hypothetical protein
MNQPATAEQQATSIKGRLTSALADLAVMDEQREKLCEEITALRNYLNGINLGQRIAAERARAEAEAKTPAAE